ncbi:nucleotidyltransferase family protein [Alloacidobacterium dinghuense]|uniref:Nucleotidyltransferase family protein n=1 Tax=Alloacidobacterium dinghuense TaxID=2763107 RepID=A0A7G8BDX4_9BACT|nr:nucleotidyltransferase family protein [Alloacidobacterium dinghuense]QNI30744.1 nucleotidyltransferase family protein [Alloacidobacterium dinghuense]
MQPHPIGNGICAPRIPREVAALIAALQLKGANTEALMRLEDREWESLLRFCDPSHLTLPLSQVESRGFPEWVVERLQRNAADNAERFTHVKSAYQEVAVVFRECGVDCVVLKGFTQAPEFVANTRLRQQSDLDLYCPKKMIRSAKAALESIGYQPENIQDYSRADHLPTMIRHGDWQWRGNAFDPDMPLSVELHFCLWNEDVSRFSVPELDNFWERRITRSLEDISFRALDPVDHLGYLALHILRGLLLADWVIHHVHELATFLHRHAKDDRFWKTWKERHSTFFRALQAIAFFHAMSWFCCDVHEEVLSTCRQLDEGIQEWLRRFTGASLEGMFRQNKKWVWLHASLLKSPVEKRQFLRQALLPSVIPTMSTPSVRLKNREPRRFGRSHLYGQYLSYLASRVATHAYLIPATLFQGLALWLSQRQPRKQL